MDEGSREQERQPVIPNIFPVSEKSVSTAFEELGPQGNSSNKQKAVEEELERMREKNPHILASFEDLIEPQRPEIADQMRLGSIICYRVLREEASARGGVLPSLKKDFVDEYEEEEERKLGDEVEDKASMERDEVGPQMRRAYIAKFRIHEPVFSKIVEEEFKQASGDQSNRVPEDDFKYTGLILQYSLFREGFKDPKNFQR